MTLLAALAALPEATSEWDTRVTTALPPGAVTLGALGRGAEALADWIAAKRGQAAGGDDRLGCAYLVGDLSWQLGHLLGGLWLTGWHVGSIDPESVALSRRAVDWEAEGEKGRVQVIDLQIDPAGWAKGADDPKQLSQTMTALHEPIIDHLARTTGLGAAAQWRLVGDGLTGALLERGKALSCLPQALTLGRGLLADRQSRLASRQAEFVEISLPGQTAAAPPRAKDWFRLRGGCCRYYTAEGGDYCSTCVLRKRDDQISRLQTYLSELQATG